MQLMYRDYKFSFIPIIIGAMGAIPKNITDKLIQLGIEQNDATKLLRKLQSSTIIGTVKICKTFLQSS